MTNPKIREKPVCACCGSDDVVLDATAAWDIDAQEWVLNSTFDDAYCNTCETEDCKLNWPEVPEGNQDGSSNL